MNSHHSASAKEFRNGLVNVAGPSARFGGSGHCGGNEYLLGINRGYMQSGGSVRFNGLAAHEFPRFPCSNNAFLAPNATIPSNATQHPHD
jgi:hypothetical protein